MYRVSARPVFEGPLDLLLFFVRRDELDIHDIPIARIADEYLEAVRTLDALAGAGVDLDAAADFIYTAALLIQIKTRMLMPRAELGDDGEPIDPPPGARRPAARVRALQGGRGRARGPLRGAAAPLHPRAGERPSASASGRAQETTFRATPLRPRRRARAASSPATLRREAAPPLHTVEREAYAIDEQREFVLERLGGRRRLVHVALVAPTKSRAFDHHDLPGRARPRPAAGRPLVFGVSARGLRLELAAVEAEVRDAEHRPSRLRWTFTRSTSFDFAVEALVFASRRAAAAPTTSPAPSARSRALT